MADKHKLQTLVNHDEHDERHYGAVHVPVYNTSLFTFGSYAEMDRADADPAGHYSYSRGNNPSVVELEERLARLEGGEKARCFGSGMGAISAAVLSVAGAGDHIVCVDQVYGPARKFMGDYLKRLNIDTTFVDGTSLAEIEAAIRENTRLLYLESPSSLLFQLQDLEACSRLADQYGLTTIIDNTWSTPCFQNPLRYGIDLVVHSLTKYIGGHSDAMGGAVIGSKERIDRISLSELVLLGSILHPQTASLIMRGLRTLPLRMEKQQANGAAVAGYLAALPFIDKVHYPALPGHPQAELAHKQMSGFGSLFSFQSGHSIEKLKAFADELSFFRIGFSWGGYESLVTVQQALYGSPRISVPVVRLYIGLEEPEDLIKDLQNAFRLSGFS